MLFSFTAGTATGVSFTIGAAQRDLYAPNTLMNLEGFDASGNRIGSVTFDVFTASAINVSAAFGNVPLSGFRVYGSGGAPGVTVGITVMAVSFTPPDPTAPTVTATANKTTLSPANGKAVAVQVTGTITDNAGGSGINGATVGYTVDDEYDLNEPAGGITLSSDGSYAFTVLLPASRKDTDKDGRTFTIVVSARDVAGNLGSKSVVDTVPHDQCKK